MKTIHRLYFGDNTATKVINHTLVVNSMEGIYLDLSKAIKNGMWKNK